MLTFKAGSHLTLASPLTEIKMLPANGFESNICIDSIFQVINLTTHGYSQFRLHVGVKHVFPEGVCLYLSIKPSMLIFFNSFLLFFSSNLLEFYFVMYDNRRIPKNRRNRYDYQNRYQAK